MTYRNPTAIKGETTAEILAELFVIKDQCIVDIGCGDGALVRTMAGLGASASGVEPNAGQIDGARSAEPVADEHYILGGAEELPYDVNTIDLAVFSNSLHHVPVDLQATALREAGRVLRSGGYVLLTEPLPEGAHKELLMPVQDETDVQAHASRAILDACVGGMTMEREEILDRTSTYRDYDQFRDAMIRVDPARAAAFSEHDQDLRQRFARLGKADGEGRAFNQLIRVNVLRKN